MGYYRPHPHAAVTFSPRRESQGHRSVPADRQAQPIRDFAFGAFKTSIQILSIERPLWVKSRHRPDCRTSSRRTVELAEALDLPALGVEILRIEPAFERRLARRPVAIEDREPGRVPVPPVADHVLAEDALELEAVAQRRAPRRRVERVAFPFVAPIAQFLDGVAREEVLRFGAEWRALQGR